MMDDYIIGAALAGGVISWYVYLLWARWDVVTLTTAFIVLFIFLLRYVE